MAENKHYLSVAWNDRKQKYLAVISEGQPRLGDQNVKVCALELFDKQQDATPWFKQQMETMPWLQRN